MRMEMEGKGVRLRCVKNEWELSVLLFADDAVLVAKSREKMKMLVREFIREYGSKGLKVNSKKVK